MGNHKRKGPKSTRGGCLLCKPHKRQGVNAPTRQEQRASDKEAEELRQEIIDMMAEEAEEIEFSKLWNASENDDG